MQTCRLILFTLVIASACVGQNARDYYEELYTAGGLDRFADGHVCFFDDENSDTFFTFGQTKLLREYMIEHGTFGKLSKSAQAELKKDSLIFRGYVKGVPHPQEDFMYPKDGSWVSDRFMLDARTPAEVRFSIVWQTLRFKRTVERIRSNGSTFPVATTFGRCEAVAPGVRQHGD